MIAIYEEKGEKTGESFQSVYVEETEQNCC